MKYCIHYTPNMKFKYIAEMAELTIDFRREDTTITDFMLQNKDKIINVAINDKQDFIDNNCIKLFNAIATEHSDVHFRFKIPSYKAYKDFYDLLQENEIKHEYFFAENVCDWDTLHGYMNLNPTSIYIAEDLGFELKTVAEMLHGRGIEVRCYPNVAQSNWNETPALKKFFIRPEDISFYEPYVDVCEFFGDEKKLNTYYKIYAKDKKWSGNLQEIIISLNGELDSRFIVPSFAKYRLKCGKRCLKGHGCQICEATERLSAALKDKGIMVKVPKE